MTFENDRDSGCDIVKQVFKKSVLRSGNEEVTLDSHPLSPHYLSLTKEVGNDFTEETQFGKHVLSICCVPGIVAIGNTEMTEIQAVPSEASRVEDRHMSLLMQVRMMGVMIDGESASARTWQRMVSSL